MLDSISQIGIFFLGITSVVLVARKNKWGFVAGLLAQPFWFYTSYVNEQWGIFLASFAYAASWTYGVYEWFCKKQERIL